MLARKETETLVNTLKTYEQAGFLQVSARPMRVPTSRADRGRCPVVTVGCGSWRGPVLCHVVSTWLADDPTPLPPPPLRCRSSLSF
jgi:hypothetical protein